MKKSISTSGYRGFKSQNTKSLKKKQKLKQSQSFYGGITLEYILVTTFSVVATMAALSFMKKVVSSKVQAISKELSIEQKDGLDFFD